MNSTSSLRLAVIVAVIAQVVAVSAPPPQTSSADSNKTAPAVTPDDGFTKESLSKLLWVEKTDSNLPTSGCYVVDKRVKKLFPQPVSVPLKNIEYDVKIIGSLAKVKLTQKYFNPLANPLEIEFRFPMEPNACLYNFKATFGDKVLVGRVKERNQATQEYQQAIAEGKEAAIATINEQSKDIINLKIGNVPGETAVEIEVEYTQELEASLSSFWRFTAYSTVTPRYINDWPSMQIATPAIYLPSTKPTYTWSFKVIVISQKAITFFNSTSHRLSGVSSSDGNKQISFTLDFQEVPNKDFIFVYSTGDMSTPFSLVGQSEDSTTAVLTFLPKFTSIDSKKAYELETQGKELDFDLKSARGEYIFVLDRSGSMLGTRVERAKKALLLFLKSLPQDSYFQIYSFGSSYSTLFTNSKRYEDASLKVATDHVAGINADMGGTEIAQPLQAIFATKILPGYPRQVFLLTDGEVSNTDSVIELVKRNTQFTRVSTIGIGNGASPALIKGCAQKGKGKYTFIQDNEDISAKVVELLSAVLSPSLTNFSFDYDSSLVDTVIPNPKNMPYVLKNDPVNIYVIFKANASGTFNFNLTYSNSFTNQNYTISQSLEITGDKSISFLDKLAHFRALSILSDSLTDRTRLDSEIAVSDIGDIKAYVVKQSVKHQVLNQLTAFLCVEQTKQSDGSYRDTNNLPLVNVVVPQYGGIDYGLLGKDPRTTTVINVNAGSGSGMVSRLSQPYTAGIWIGGSANGVGGGGAGGGVGFGIGGNAAGGSPGLMTSYAYTLRASPSKPNAPNPQLKQNANKSIVDTIDELVLLQKTDGSWDSLDILDIVGKLKADFDAVKKQYVQDNLLLTIYAIGYIEHYNLQQYALVMQKANDWVTKTAAQLNVSGALIAQAKVFSGRP